MYQSTCCYLFLSLPAYSHSIVKRYHPSALATTTEGEGEITHFGIPAELGGWLALGLKKMR
jgi:hypothetical protein